MDAPRKGRQTPTQSATLPYTQTHGQEAVDLYNTTGRTAQEWQALLVYDILAQNDEGLWVHTKYGYSVPRRNGKNEIVAIRELWGLQQGEMILHTAHRTTTSHAAWERLLQLLDLAKLPYKSLRATGRESVTLDAGGRAEFRTRSSKGGLGEGFDLLVVDEAQEYTDDQESALKYIVTDSQNPQTIFCGTPPTLFSSGTVFTKLRSNILEGAAVNSGWAEWSVADQSDPRDRKLWYETNPSLGTVFTERSVADEIGSDVVDFNIQRLGLWIRYNQKSAVSAAEWKELQVEQLPKLTGKLFVGIKYGHDGQHAAMSVAVRTEAHKIFVETIDCRPVRAGNSWIVSFLRAADVQNVVVDGAGGQSILTEELKDARVKAKTVLPTVKEIISANAAFEQGLYQQSICHKGQPSLAQVVSNCEKRAIGSNGGFGYKAIHEEQEIALMDSMILAHWSCAGSKAREKQKISY